MERTEVAVIGAGVVGLAAAAKLSSRYQTVVLEKNRAFGEETSSRNSEVIHSGIYYPQGTLKAALCVSGNRLMYAYCQAHGVAHRRLGKIIVATDEAEVGLLRTLAENGKRNGVDGLQWLEPAQVRAMEPEITCRAGLWSPSTGILDTHGFMRSLEAEARAHGAVIAYASEVVAVRRENRGYRLAIHPEGSELEAACVVNCAGLHSARVAALAGMDPDAAGYRLHYCKGSYFRTAKRLNVQRLVYPVPGHGARGLGIHLTKDLAGGTRFGPDTEYVPEIAYAVDSGKQAAFCQAIQKYLPGIQCQDLYPDTAGVRPKLQGPEDGFRDFVIREESERGWPGFINLIGIESPGLTSSLAIADGVAGLVGRLG